MNEISLRPYQKEFIDNVREEFSKGKKKVCGVAPCGAGKTIITGWMIREALERGKKSLFFVHRNELIEQTSKTFSMLNIPHGIISTNCEENYNLPVQIASVQTLVRRLDKIPTPDFLICDECHHILANSYMTILKKFKDAFLLGVTATPQRMGGIGLGDVFDAMVLSPSTSELINLGNLTKFHYFAPNSKKLDLNNVKINSFGEFDNKSLETVMSGKEIIGDIVENYKLHANGKSAVCYCVNIEHSKTVADAFNSAGIAAAHCDGETPKLERSKIVEDFRLGKTKVLCNAELFGEGFDVPNMQAVILARPTKSLTLFTQQSMRAMRPDPDEPNKIALIIDHTKNFQTFGLPDEPRSWSLSQKQKKGTGEAPVKVCPQCDAVVAAATKVCPECGFVFYEDEIVTVKGNLEKVEDENEGISFHQRRKIYPPNSPENFLEISKEKNYKMGWVAFKSLKFAKSLEDCIHIAEICGYKKGWANFRWNEIKTEKNL